MAIPLKQAAGAAIPPGFVPGTPLPPEATTVQAVSLTIEEELQALRAENARLRAAKPVGKITWRVCDRVTVDPKTKAEKDPSYAVSVYGLGRFPVTLYSEQWQRLANVFADFQHFLTAPETVALTSKASKS